MPVAIALVGAVASILGALNRMSEHPIIAYVLILGFLWVDSSISSLLGFQGAVGWFISTILNFITGMNIQIFTWQLFIIFGSFWLMLMLWKLA